MAYYFPPIGGGGTARSVAFAKWLPQFGVQPFVVSVAPEKVIATREFQFDSSLESKDELRGERVPATDRLSGFRRKLKQWKLYPFYWFAAYPWEYEGYRPWAANACRAVVREHNRQPFELIYATAGPNSSLEFAAKAARQTRLPWIADLRDPWNTASLKHYPSRRHYRWEKSLEKRLLQQASAIIMNTPGAHRLMCDWLGSDVARRITWIPNGYEAAGAPNNTETNGLPNGPDRFQLVHTGTMYAPNVRSSRPGRYFSNDINDTARSLVPVARAVRKVLDRRPDLAKRLCITQMGYVPEALETAVNEIVPETGVFQFLGVRPREEAQAALASADALLVVQVAWGNAATEVPHIPGKVYDYLPLSKPIFAPVPPGDLRQLLERMPQAIVMDYQDTNEISRQLEALVDGEEVADTVENPIRLDRLTRESQACDLAELMRRVTRNEPFDDLTRADFA